MPKIAIYKSFYIFFWSYDLQERRHVHITKGRKGMVNAAKFWLDTLTWFDNGDLTTKELNELKKVISKNLDKINMQIDNFAEGKKNKLIKL